MTDPLCPKRRVKIPLFLPFFEWPLQILSAVYYPKSCFSPSQSNLAGSVERPVAPFSAPLRSVPDPNFSPRLSAGSSHSPPRLKLISLWEQWSHFPKTPVAKWNTRALTRARTLHWWHQPDSFLYNDLITSVSQQPPLPNYSDWRWRWLRRLILRFSSQPDESRQSREVTIMN